MFAREWPEYLSGDLGWSHTRLADMASFPKEVVTFRLQARRPATSGSWYLQGERWKMRMGSGTGGA